jgi:putative SOS response-associated peptidase YedK
MCVKLKGSGMSPGQIMAFMTKLGKAGGIWGITNGAQPNARVESLKTSWKAIQHNRGILSVDSFWERGKEFVSNDKKNFNVCVIYNAYMEFAVITAPANAVVKQYHDRMPLILDDDQAAMWLNGEEGAKLEQLPESKFMLCAA